MRYGLLPALVCAGVLCCAQAAAAATPDEHARKDWVSRTKNGLDRRKLKPLYALV